MSAYRRPLAPHRVEIEIKRSRFITTGIALNSMEDFHRFVEQIRAEHSKATHNCTAYLLGSPQRPLAAGSNDDGEPSGTAGKPMLNMLIQRGVGDVAVVVTRYFGGIKLGAGGLIRAYGQAVAALVDDWQYSEVEPQETLSVSYPYSLELNIARLFSAQRARVTAEAFDAEVHKSVAVAELRAETLRTQLRELAYLGVRLD